MCFRFNKHGALSTAGTVQPACEAPHAARWCVIQPSKHFARGERLTLLGLAGFSNRMVELPVRWSSTSCIRASLSSVTYPFRRSIARSRSLAVCPASFPPTPSIFATLAGAAFLAAASAMFSAWVLVCGLNTYTYTRYVLCRFQQIKPGWKFSSNKGRLRSARLGRQLCGGCPF